jgi:hypothetical protein
MSPKNCLDYLVFAMWAFLIADFYLRFPYDFYLLFTFTLRLPFHYTPDNTFLNLNFGKIEFFLPRIPALGVTRTGRYEKHGIEASGFEQLGVLLVSVK